MYGAIIGDLSGSTYEYEQTKSIKSIKTDRLITDLSFYSDDTILTIAVLDAILNDKDYDRFLKYYISKYKNYKPNFNPYFETSFSPNIIKWSESNETGYSKGNGALMRVSPVGYLFHNEKDVKENAEYATIPSHCSLEAIEYAVKLSLMIYYFRNKMSKEEVYKLLKIEPKYIPFDKFNTKCAETFNNCAYVIYNSNSFEDSIKNTLLMGGDTDTNACIVGSVAESIYGIDDYLIDEANKKIPHEFVKILNKVYK